jgi:hypothetical protein
VQAVGTGLGLVSRAPIDLLVIDDALADEHVRTPGARQLIRDWFEAVLFASVSPYGNVVALGTPLHPEDAVSRLASQPDVQIVRSPVVDAEGKRLAKRTAGLSIRELRQKGKTPEEVLTAPLSQLLG